MNVLSKKIITICENFLIAFAEVSNVAISDKKINYKILIIAITTLLDVSVICEPKITGK